MDRKILTINDTIHGMIELTALEKKIISCSLFNRLHDIYQNSTVYMTFPTNRTKRFEHSIGAMYLAGEMLYYSLYNAKNSDALEDASPNGAFKRFIRELKDDIEKIIEKFKYDNLEQISDKIKKFNGIQSISLESNGFKDADGFVDGHVSKKIFSLCKETDETDETNATETFTITMTLSIVYQALRIAALLHDVGHPPYSHITEKALNDLYSYCKNEKKGDAFIQIYEKIKDTQRDKALHEIIGDYIINVIFDEIIPAISPAMQEQERFNVIFNCIIEYCVKLILADGKYDENSFSSAWSALHRIIDGKIDSDRLDYVVRDGLACGIAGPQIEYKRIIYGMKLIYNGEEEKFYFSFIAKSIRAIEDFFLKRFNVYENAIYHHRVIKTDYLFLNVVEELAKEYFSQNPSSNNSHNDISGLWEALALIKTTKSDNIISILQWNDSWLISILKNEWYNRLKNSNSGNTGELLDQLAEILTNEKYYFSAVKRRYDFKHIDDRFVETLIYYHFRTGDDYFDKNYLDLKKKNKNFALQYFYYNIWSKWNQNLSPYEQKNKFEELVLKSAKDAISRFNANNNNCIVDVFIGLKTYSDPIDKDVRLYRPNENGYSFFEDFSNINEVLNLFVQLTPLFYVYIKKSDSYNGYVKANDYLCVVGEELAKNVVDLLNDRRKNK